MHGSLRRSDILTDQTEAPVQDVCDLCVRVRACACFCRFGVMTCDDSHVASRGVLLMARGDRRVGWVCPVSGPADGADGTSRGQLWDRSDVTGPRCPLREHVTVCAQANWAHPVMRNRGMYV